MESAAPGVLEGSEIHGFHTLQDLDVGEIMAEASTRWLRPNEILAILCNYKRFVVHVKPLHLPPYGTIVLYDRKVLRNFRKDGHSWRKKSDGKTVKEAHEQLKVCNEERIHVYYAYGEDNPALVRRCYWLLDKRFEHIVLVHYREVSESQGSGFKQAVSNFSSASNATTFSLSSDGTDNVSNWPYYPEEEKLADSTAAALNFKSHDERLQEINTLDWDELLSDFPSTTPASREDEVSGIQNSEMEELPISNDFLPLSVGASSSISINDSAAMDQLTARGESRDTSAKNSEEMIGNCHVHNDSVGRWISYIMTDSKDAASHKSPISSVSDGHQSSLSPVSETPQFSDQNEVFQIADFSPSSSFSTENTKVLVTGTFTESHQQNANSNLYCVCGEYCVLAEVVQVGVYRCLLPPHPPGAVDLYMSFDGKKPISQILKFEYRAPFHDPTVASCDATAKLEEFQVQMRLAALLFSTSKCLEISTLNVPQRTLKDAKKFSFRTSDTVKDWEHFIKSTGKDISPSNEAKDRLLLLMLKNRLKDWLLERVVSGFKSSDLDKNGHGVIHLCAMLGYTWSVQLFSWSGLSLDFRDQFGWTALHWAAYCGRKTMVASLLSAGAKANLVTDPTPINSGGSTAADLASEKGYDGLAAYLAESALVQHFRDMSLAGNVSGSLQQATRYNAFTEENLTEEELYLRETLAAYRTAADAAARIHAAFGDLSFKQKTKLIQSSKPEDVAGRIVAAMRIQHAFRNYNRRKQIYAAARIQHRFRAWRVRKEFLNKRRQVIKIQAAFRGYRERKQHRKIIWAVGVLEKVILRWRLNKKGFRGLQLKTDTVITEQGEENDTEEEFFRMSRRQAEERVERSVLRVQAMFRSRKAQEEYHRMKLAYSQAELEYMDPGRT